MFRSPWALRITALLLACLLFLYIRGDYDATTKTTSNEQMDIIKDVPLEVYYDDENLIVTGLPETVNVTIKGPMQIVLQTKALQDFKVFVDLRDLLMGEHTVTLQYENLSDKLDVSIDPATVDIVLEEKVTEEFKVDPEMSSSLIGDGYVLNGISVSPATVMITGAKSTIESISYVKATVAGETGFYKSFEQDAFVKVLDRELNKLDVAISPEKVNLKVSIAEYSKEIPLVLKQIGSPPNGVTINSLNLAVGTVKVTGSKSKIDQLKSIPVNIDVSKIKESKGYEVELALPDGVKTISPQKVTVNANVTVVEDKAATDQTTNQPIEQTTDQQTSPTTNTEDIDS